MKRWYRALSLALVLCFAVTLLTGCSSSNNTTSTGKNADATATPMPTVDVVDVFANAPAATGSAIPTATSTPVPLSDKQRTSINMLNYLVVFSQEVNSSRNSRLYLEEAYSSLYNNTHPNAVDARTQVEINFLFDTIESYRMIAVKRDRLQYIYEQNQAQALRDAVPSPLGLISAVQSFSLSKLVASVAYMAVDSVTSYQSGSAQADMQYLQDGWALDDEQATTLHNMRKGTFNYMVETVRDYDLPGELALTEEAVANFVEWKGYSNNLQKIQLLEANVATYQAFGPYWLTLAECYYTQAATDPSYYAKCLDAIGRYEALDLRIFRKDLDYARAMPLAIVAAEYVLSGSEYIASAEKYAAAIMTNTGNDEWALRYFAAQTSINLYGITGETRYLDTAYEITLNNVTYLLTEQKELNAAYLADVQEAPVPAGATDAQKKEIEQYNKLLKEERKTALPPVYEPLLLNVDLLFALAEQMGIDAGTMSYVNGILHENGEPLFLSRPLDLMFWIGQDSTVDTSAIATTFNGTELTLPAQYVTAGATITVTITQGEETTVIDDWRISKVERKDKSDLASFTATYVSDAVKAVKYAPDAVIVITIIPGSAVDMEPLVFEYRTVAAKTWVVFDTVSFQRVEE